jgi:CheY-like chemotaxis protein
LTGPLRLCYALTVFHMKPAPAQAPLPRILLVDDNRDGLVVRTLLLEEAGFQVQAAACGHEALDLFLSTRFDVVVTDYRMPGMNGAELIERLRAYDTKTRFIVLSGFVEPLGLTEANTGADAVIAKSANEGAHLVRWVKRLASTSVRKPMARQNAERQRARRENLPH